MTQEQIHKRLRSEVHHRAATLDRSSIDEEAHTVEVSFSSEEPVLRWWGYEILDHGAGGYDISRLNDGAAVLVNHNINEHVGVIESARIDSADKRGRAVLRFGRSALAQEHWRDVVDGIRTGTSVGYDFNPDTDMVLEEKGTKDKPPTYRIKPWTGMEISLASVPADTTVGVGRSKETQDDIHPYTEVRNMEPDTSAQDKLDAEAARKAAEEAATNATQSERAKWQERAKEVSAYIARFPEIKELDRFLDPDRPMSELHAEVRKLIDDRIEDHEKQRSDASYGEIGLSGKEVKQYNMMKLIRHLADPLDNGAAKAAEFELECSRTVANEFDKAPQGAFMPEDIVNRGTFVPSARAMTPGMVDALRTQQVGDFTTGGALVQEGPQGLAFIDLLRAAMLTRRAGVKEISGLVGDVDVPKLTSGQTSYWVGEDEDVTLSDAGLGSIKMTPKTVGCANKITRRLLKQSSYSVEAMIRTDGALSLATALDLAGLHGTGAAQPVGIASTPGIGSVAMGSNGLAITYAKLVDLEAEPSLSNAAVGSMAYMTNTRVRREARQILQNTSATDAGWIWRTGQFAEVGELLGYPAYCTNQVSNTLTKGSSTSVCSAIFFGNWADALYGLWGNGIDINVDTSTYSSSGGLKLVFLKDADFVVRRAASFAAILDVLTA